MKTETHMLTKSNARRLISDRFTLIELLVESHYRYAALI